MWFNDGEEYESDGPNEEQQQHDLEEQNDEEFDTNLPTMHKYLGKLNNVSGYTIFDDWEVVTLVAIHTNTLVFPGFVLPLVLNRGELDLMESFLSKRNCFVLICTDEQGSMYYKFAVTLEVFESFIKDNALYLKTRCRQRCKLLMDREIAHLQGRLKRITVQILPEPAISTPLKCTQLFNLQKRKPLIVDNYKKLVREYKIRRFHLSQFPLPSWVYDRNEVCFYMEYMIRQLRVFYIDGTIPKDPTLLSYWFVQNYQLTHLERLHILSLGSTIERLRVEFNYMQTGRIMCCAICKAEVAQQSDVFAMSKDGVQSNYCNPDGYVYETVTVTAARNFTLHGSPRSYFSWFPGYVWTIMQCAECHTHLGWKFTSRTMHPRAFYGLTKIGLEMKILPNS